MPYKPIPTTPVKKQFFFGNLNGFRNDTIGFLLDPINVNLDMYRVQLTPFYSMLIANDVDLLHEILITKVKSFTVTDISKYYFSESISGLNTETDPAHTMHRTSLNPYFVPTAIQGDQQLIIDNALKTLKKWKEGDVVNLFEEMADISIAIIARILFGDDLINEDFDALVKKLTMVQEDVIHKVHSIDAIFPWWIPTPDNARINKIRYEVADIVRGVLKKRRENNIVRDDVFNTFMTAKMPDGSNIGDEQIVHHATFVLLAGHETSATMMSLALYTLSRAKNKDIYEKVVADLNTGSIIYLKKVINETLRFYPSAWAINKKASEDVQVGDYLIKKGELVLIPLISLNRKEKFFPNANTFNPERWPDPTKRDHLMSFGMGEHYCLGSNLAVSEGENILKEVIERFKYSPIVDEDPYIEPHITIRAKRPLLVKIDKIVKPID